MNRQRIFLMGIVALVSVSPVTRAQTPDVLPDPERPNRRLLGERGATPVTSPDRAQSLPERPDFSEAGRYVVDRPGRFEYRPDLGWYLLTLPATDEHPEQTARWVLPSRLLQAVEKVLHDHPAARFRVSGETTVYDNKAFIFLLTVSEMRVEAPPNAPTKTTSDPDAPLLPVDADPHARPSVESPPKTPEPRTSRTQPAAGDPQRAILEQMLRDRPGRPVIAQDEGAVSAGESAAPVTGRPLSEDRGEMRVDRLVTIVRDATGQWWEARFQGDNTLRERPIRLLPNRLLWRAEMTLRDRPFDVPRFRVTGLVTRYRGRPYMLLRKLIIVRDLGQF